MNAPDPTATPLEARGDADAVELDGEVFICRDGRIHRLNTTAALVWAGCDGATDPETLVHRLAADFGVQPEVVRADVERATRELEAAGLLGRGPDTPPLTLLEPPAACSGCGPGPRFDTHVLVEVDGGVLAVGADRAFGRALAQALPGRVVGVVDDPVDRASYGVVLPTAGARGAATEVARLVRGPDVLARSRRAEPVVRALLTQIGAHARPPGLALLEAVAVGNDDAVVLVPPSRQPVRFERHAAGLGLRVAASALVAIDAAAGRAVVGAPWLHADHARLDRAVEGRARIGTEPRNLAWGDYRIAGVVASAPDAGRVFGELGPTAPLGASGDALGAVIDLCDRVPVIVDGDLPAVAEALRAPRR